MIPLLTDLETDDEGLLPRCKEGALDNQHSFEFSVCNAPLFVDCVEALFLCKLRNVYSTGLHGFVMNPPTASCEMDEDVASKHTFDCLTNLTTPFDGVLGWVAWCGGLEMRHTKLWKVGGERLTLETSQDFHTPLIIN